MIPEVELVKDPETGKIVSEEWRAIAGYEGIYEVSNYGRVKSLPNRRRNGRGDNDFYTTKEIILKPGRMAQTGYLSVSLKSKTHSIHRLVAKAFIPNPDSKRQVNHIDKNKQNNAVSNLEWCTERENTVHGFLGYKKSKYPGISWSEDRKRWIVYISVDGVAKYIGRSDKEDIAHKIYLNGLKRYKIENKYSKVAV